MFERNRLLGNGMEAKALIITAQGTAYSKDSARKVMHDIGKRVGFPIRPLMLRHSYAVHTLFLLRGSPDFRREPLMYLRDRMGHRSVQTTLVYLKQIERLAGGEALAMMAEFDRIFGIASALHNR